MNELTNVIQNQIENNIFISKHLTGKAIDVRSGDMDENEKQLFEQIVKTRVIKFIRGNSSAFPH